MKRVFNSASDVIHLFAQKSQEDARSSNTFMECNEWRKSKHSKLKDNIEFANLLYSYGHHYKLAEFLDNNTVMINDSGYSSTTVKHISLVSSATRQYHQFYFTQTDLYAVYNKVKRLVRKLATARKKELYTEPIRNLYNSLNEFIDYAKLKVKRSKEYKFIKKIYDNVSNPDFIEAERAAVLIQRKKRAAAKAIKEKKDIIDFLDYKTNWINLDKDILRLSKDSTKVETSQGVKVDIEDAFKLYRMIERGIDIVGHRISYYQVTSIKGTLKIGCHNIDLDSVNKVGKQLEALLN